MRGDDQDKSAPAPSSPAADKIFLGAEFLTWLFFHLEDEGWATVLKDAFPDRETAPPGDEVRFAMGTRTALKTIDKSGIRVNLAGPQLDDSGELLQAVRHGALIDSMDLQMAIGDRVYGLTLKAGDGGLSSVKFPDLFTEPDENFDADDEDEGDGRPRRRGPSLDDVLALRMSCLDEVENVIDALFSRFVTRRVARAWQSEEMKSMRKKVAAGLAARLASVNGD